MAKCAAAENADRSKIKYAVFTMDVETFNDTDAVADLGIKHPEHMLDGFGRYIRILDKYGIKSSLFVLQSCYDEIKDELLAANANGHRIAVHGMEHVAPVDITPEKFRADILKVKQQLEADTGSEVRGYRAPFFSIDNAHLDILRELGFKYDASNMNFLTANHTVDIDLGSFDDAHQGVLKDKGFYEFGHAHTIFGIPISGGGYVRLIPWIVMRPALKHYIKNNDYYMFYLHPFEISEVKVPHLKGLSFVRRLYLRMCRRAFPNKIEWLIKYLKKQGYEFRTFEELCEEL